jgi:hypothetical protein
MCTAVVERPEEIRLKCFQCQEFFFVKDSVFPELDLVRKMTEEAQLIRFCTVDCLVSFVVVKELRR